MGIPLQSRLSVHGIVAHPTSGPLSQPTIQRGQLLRPWPQFTTLFGEGENVGHSSYHGFQAQFKQRFSAALFTFAYTFSKSIGDTETRSDFQELGGSSVGSDGFEDIYNRRLNRAISIQDTPHRVVAGLTLELPLGSGKRFLSSPGVMNRVVSGWEINGIYSAQVGNPLPLYNVNNLTGNYTAVTDVYGTFNSNSFPNNNGQNPKINAPPESRLNQWFNTSDFSQPPPFTYGTNSRTITTVRNHSINNLDFGLFKNNRFGSEGRFNLQLRGEFFNAANHVRFGYPGLAFGNATFGVISSRVNNPRQIQVAMKLLF